jgi:hypothetical protein
MQMRRSPSIASLSSVSSNDEETMQIFVKNVSGQTSESHPVVPTFGTGETTTPRKASYMS